MSRYSKCAALMGAVLMAITLQAQSIVTDAAPGLSMTSKSARPGISCGRKMPCRLLRGVSEREYTIYLPGSYATDTLRSYPVLYLLHGGGLSHSDFEQNCNLSGIADSLAVCGAIADMIIVTPEANRDNMMYFNTTEGRAGAPDWQYENFFFREFIPYIESNYRVRTDRGGRAIGGFSMGGGAATVYGLHHPEMFAMVYDISGYQRPFPLEFLKTDPSAPWRQQAVADNNPIETILSGSAAQTAAWRQVDWKIAVGDRDFTLEMNMDLAKALRGKEIPFAMYVDAGDHDHRWVTPVLADLLRRASRPFSRRF